MPDTSASITIRPFRPEDRPFVRQISCETSFLEEDHRKFIDDEEMLADLLTVYFTDDEPESSLVAISQNQVIGYLTGAVDSSIMYKVMGKKIIPQLAGRIFTRGLVWKLRHWKFIFRLMLSYFRGEFFMPDVTLEFPAILHINIRREFRGQKIGEKLISAYLDYLRLKNIPGVHLGTFSEKAKEFFLKQGFKILFERQRSYLKPYIGRNIVFYIFGKKIN